MSSVLTFSRPPARAGSPTVYLLHSPSTRRTYTGTTTDLARRLRQHNGTCAGGAKATRAGRPWTCVGYVHGFATYGDALAFECAWKKRGGRARPRGVDTVTWRMQVGRTMVSGHAGQFDPRK